MRRNLLGRQPGPNIWGISIGRIADHPAGVDALRICVCNCLSQRDTEPCAIVELLELFFDRFLHPLLVDELLGVLIAIFLSHVVVEANGFRGSIHEASRGGTS